MCVSEVEFHAIVDLPTSHESKGVSILVAVEDNVRGANTHRFLAYSKDTREESRASLAVHPPCRWRILNPEQQVRADEQNELPNADSTQVRQEV
jgi:hypothetical protein